MHEPGTTAPPTRMERLGTLADRLHELSFRGHVADPASTCPDCMRAVDLSRQIVDVRRQLTEAELFAAYGAGAGEAVRS